MPVVDVAMNVEADRIEGSLGRRIMNTCHGFWSVGSIIGGLSGAVFASLEVDIRWHLAIVGAVSLPIALAVAYRLPQAPTEPRGPEERRFRIALPTLSLMPLCIFAFGMLLVEAAALDWSSLFLRSVMEATPFGAGIGFAAFTIAMAVGRFLGDWAAGRFGPVAVARTCGVIGLAGLVVGHGPDLPPGGRRPCRDRSWRVGGRATCRQRRREPRRPTGRGQCRGALADLVQRLPRRAAAGRFRRGMERQPPDRPRHAHPRDRSRASSSPVTCGGP